MSDAFRLQELSSFSSAQTQRPEFARDLGADRYLTLQVRKFSTTTSGTLKLQHAPVLDEAAFEDVASPTFDLAATGSLVGQFSNLHRFVRWNISAIVGTTKLLIDGVSRDGNGGAATFYRLQEPMTMLTGTPNQRIDAAIDILGSRSVAVQCRKLSAGGAGCKVWLQHAAVLDEDAFMDIVDADGFTPDAHAYFEFLSNTTTETHGFTNLLRFLRWKPAWVTPNPVFGLDCTARSA